MSERDLNESASDEIDVSAVRAPGVSNGASARPEPTVGTGSFFAIGCVILLVIAVIVLGAIFFRP